mgnify:CR=1 FL=1
MNSGRTHKDYLTDILDAVQKAEQFISSMTFQEFKAEDKIIFAVVRALENVEVVWKTVTEDVPRLKPAIESILFQQ